MFPVEQGDLHKRWKLVNMKLRNFHKCVVLPIGSLMLEMSFLMKVVLEAGKNFSKNTLLRSARLVMDLGAR